MTKAVLHQVDQIIHSKRKTIAIEVLPGGKVIVRAPLYASDRSIAAALASRADWLANARQKMAVMDAGRQPKRYIEDELFWYLGRQYPLHLVGKTKSNLRFDGHAFLLSNHSVKDTRQEFTEWYRESTRDLVSEFVRRYQKSHGFQVGGVRITSAKTRWGSCSGKNNLNFTYRLCMAPLSAVEYVVVHELVHTRIKNHSSQFWQGVTSVFPGWKKERAWLNKNGIMLHLE